MKKISSNNIALAILLSSALIAIAIIINALIPLLPNNNPSSPQKIYENITYVKTTDRPYLGNPDAKVTIIEYLDFECPFCKKAYDEIFPPLKKEYIDTNKIKFVFKNLPIIGLHKNAFIKAEAALCAYDQGSNPAYVRYHDELFNRFISNPATTKEELIALATQNGSDNTTFRDCLDSRKYKTLIEKDRVESITINSTGTPTWLIGKTKSDGLSETVKINGVQTYSVYKTIIDQLLEN